MKKWAPFFGATQTPNGTVGTHEPDPLPVITAADAKMFGLENFGNTCYANSVLQALYFCTPFRDLLVQYPDASQPNISLLPPPAATFTPLSCSTSPSRPKSSRKHSMSDPSSLPTTSIPNSNSSSSIPPSPPTLLSALRSLYVYISRNPAEKGTVAPRAFIDKLKELNELFRSTMHQDAHEFLNYLLNQIVEEMDEQRKKSLNGNGNGHAIGHGSAGTPPPPANEDLSASIGSLSVATTATGPHTNSSAEFIKSTLVHKLFEGTLTSETRCLTCETVSSRDESFLDLSIDIEQNSSVTACLRQFSASEMLCQRNKFFCDGCCDLQEAEKRMKIKKLPNILALHLKRFKYQEDLGKYIKLAYRVAFPLELRLFNTVDGTANPDRLYELFAIVVHIGSGPHHGHYVSIVKARGTWYLFDDDKIEAIKETDIPRYFGDSNSGSAYVLYYQAADLDYAALGLQPTDSAPLNPEPSPSPTYTSHVNLASKSSLSHSGVESSTIVEATENHGTPVPGSASTSTPASTSTSTSTSTSRPLPHPPGLPVPPVPSTTSTPEHPNQQQHQPKPKKQLPALNLSSSLPSTTSTSKDSITPDQTSSLSTSTPSPSAPPTPSASSSTRTFFGTIRRTPSLLTRPSTSSGVVNRNSKSVATTDAPPVPPLPGVLGGSVGSKRNGNGRPASAGGVSPARTATPIEGSSSSSSAIPLSPQPPLSPPPLSPAPSPQVNGTPTNTPYQPVKKVKERSSGSSWLRGMGMGFRTDKDKEKEKERDKEKNFERSTSLGGNVAGHDEGTGGLITFKRVSRRASDAILAHHQQHQHQHSSPLQQSSTSSLRAVPEGSSTPVSVEEGEERRRTGRRPVTAGATLDRERRSGKTGEESRSPPLPALTTTMSEGGGRGEETNEKDPRIVSPVNGVASLWHHMHPHHHDHDHQHNHDQHDDHHHREHHVHDGHAGPPASTTPPTAAAAATSATAAATSTSNARAPPSPIPRPHTHHQHQQPRPQTSYAPPSSFSTSNGTSSTFNTTNTGSETGSSSSSGLAAFASSGSGASTSGGKMKRASRKLSFTTAMLGFGKKDKDRESKHRPQSPSHSQTSSRKAGKAP